MRSVLTIAVMLSLAGCAAETCKDHPCSPDQRLTEAVRNSLNQHISLVVDTLRVETEDGTVYVRGVVSTYLEFQQVDQYVRAVPGVKRFVNATTIENRY